jgi:hypothetical protein
MKLDRNITGYNGRGKYALVRLRGIEPNSDAMTLLAKLAALGHVDFGEVGHPDEFFVIKLRMFILPARLEHMPMLLWGRHAMKLI